MKAKFQAPFRLRNKVQIKNVFDAGKRLANGNIFLIFTPNDKNHPRLVIIVSKKKLRKAVDRVFFRRIAREVFRSYLEQIKNIDIVILPNNGIVNLTRQELKLCLRKSLTKLILQLNK